jgi:hypothetical protein
LSGIRKSYFVAETDDVIEPAGWMKTRRLDADPHRR